MRCAAALLASAAAAAAGWEATPESFTAWRALHQREYRDDSEAAARFATWQRNFEAVAAHNAGDAPYRMAMTRFADLTNEEYRAQILRPRRGAAPRAATVTSRNGTAPDEWTWRDRGVVTKVKDQGQCGSCWAFSAVAAIEGAYNLQHQGAAAEACSTTCGPEKVACCSFSEQEIVSCTNTGKTHNTSNACDVGGEMEDAFTELARGLGGRLNLEDQYPYALGGGGKLPSCRPRGGAVDTGVRSHETVPSGDEAALKAAAYAHPVVSVGIDAGSFGFQLYGGGLYVDHECNNTAKALNHGVALVGYGTGAPPAPPPAPPNTCGNNHYKSPCQKDKQGCNWCCNKDKSFCWCQGGSGCDASRSEADSKPLPASSDYWLVKNSWSSDWGDDGYVYMSRGANNQCGIATDAVYPVLG